MYIRILRILRVSVHTDTYTDVHTSPLENADKADSRPVQSITNCGHMYYLTLEQS